MADNLTTQSNTPSTVPAASVIATDDVSGAHYQKFKLDVGGDGVSIAATGDATNGLDVDVTRVQGTVTVGDGGSTLSVDDGGGSLTVDGTVGISGTVPVSGSFYQATQPVSGTVAVTGAYQATQPVSLATAPTTPVTGTFWQATQPISGTVTATGPLTNTELRLTAVPVSLATAPTTPVTGTFWQATQPVSGTVTATGPLTDAELRATALPISGSVTISDGSGPVTVDGTVVVTGVATAANQLPNNHNVVVTSAPTTAVTIATMPTTPVTGTFYQGTQPVSLASVPSHDVTNAGTFSVQSATAPIASMVKGVSSATNGTSSFQVVALVASKQLAITSISVVNTGTAATLVTLQNGSGGTAIYATMAPPGGGSNITLPTPILTTSGVGLFAVCATASSSVTVCAAGYSV